MNTRERKTINGSLNAKPSEIGNSNGIALNNIDDKNFDYEKQLEHSRREENDHLVSSLITNIRNVKNFSLQIQNNIKQSNATLDEMNKKYTESNSLLSDTVKKLTDVLSANSSYFCFLVIFLFVIFFFLYKITK